MECQLEKRIDHREVQPKYREALFHCNLLADGKGMTSMGVICAGCCLRFAQILDVKRDLLLTNRVSVNEYESEPSIIGEYLTERLKPYFDLLNGLGKTVKDLESACVKCKAIPVNKPEYSTTIRNATPAHYVNRNDLKVIPKRRGEK